MRGRPAERGLREWLEDLRLDRAGQPAADSLVITSAYRTSRPTSSGAKHETARHVRSGLEHMLWGWKPSTR